MSKKKKISANYLEKIPERSQKLRWSTNEEGIVTLEIDNVGFFNKLAQKLLKKPPVSYIHLDKFGSFVWQLIDGEKNLLDMGESIREAFGDDAEPLYERLAKFFQILESYGFISFK